MKRGARLAAGSRQGFVLVEILVVLVLLMLGAALFFGLKGGKQKVESEPAFEGEAQTTLGKARQAGISVECRNNLSQLRHMIQMESMDGGLPPKLSKKWNLALKCPVSGYAYKYDPRTGKVSCPTPGHETY